LHRTNCGALLASTSQAVVVRAVAAEQAPSTTAQPYGRVFNFSAGPAVLPVEVLEQAQADLLNWQGSGAHASNQPCGKGAIILRWYFMLTLCRHERYGDEPPWQGVPEHY
jgi:hypothetical protein